MKFWKLVLLIVIIFLIVGSVAISQRTQGIQLPITHWRDGPMSFSIYTGRTRPTLTIKIHFWNGHSKIWLHRVPSEVLRLKAAQLIMVADYMDELEQKTGQ